MAMDMAYRVFARYISSFL